MEGNSTFVVSGDGTKQNFAYDRSFWSFDNSGDFASQSMIYEKMGQPLLDSAFEGYNTCLFAYGQVQKFFFSYPI